MRKPGWNARLNAVIEEFRRQPMRYGAVDCAVLAAAAIEAITGEKPGKPAWYRYSTQQAALDVMRETGFANLADLVASILPEIHPSQATLGDIAAIPSDSAFGFGLGVVSGDRIFVFNLDRSGLGTVGLLTATRAFRVG